MNPSGSYDVIIVGAGPAGSTLAYHLATQGRKVLIVEKEHFPRDRIGESLTGEAGKLLHKMGLEERMADCRFPVKKGVTVSGPNAKNSFFVPVQDRNEKGEFEPRTTWQVRRPEFDQILLETACEQGVSHLIAEARDVVRSGERVSGLKVRLPCGTEQVFSCRILADASGYNTFLSKCGVSGPRVADRYSKQIAFYAHLENVKRDTGPNSGDTVLFYSKRDHWSWHIPIDDNLTSIGIVMPAEVYRKSKQSAEDFFTRQLQILHPEIADRTSSATRLSPVWSRFNYSYQISDFVGKGYICIGDAHQFLDPVFSFGVWVGLKEAELAASAIEETLDRPDREEQAFEAFQSRSVAAQKILQCVINTFWDYPLVFLKLAHYTHKDQIADLLAGRVFEPSASESEVVCLMQDLLAKKGRDLEQE